MSEIYRRVDFGINMLDEPDERISVEEIEVSVPTRERRISHDLSEEDSNSVSLGEKAARRSPLITVTPHKGLLEKRQTKEKE